MGKSGVFWKREKKNPGSALLTVVDHIVDATY